MAFDRWLVLHTFVVPRDERDDEDADEDAAFDVVLDQRTDEQQAPKGEPHLITASGAHERRVACRANGGGRER